MGFTSRPNRKPAPKNYRAKQHVYDGFPHQSTAYPHHCICLDTCCQDDRPEVGKGCICKLCPCQHGYSHDDYLRRELDALEHQRVTNSQA